MPVTRAILLLVLAAFAVVVSGQPPTARGTHAHVGNQGERFRLPWSEALSHNANRGPSTCEPAGVPCHLAGEVDFALASGEAVKAVGDGTLFAVGYDSCVGNYVEIAHDVNGVSYKSAYYHLSSWAPFRPDGFEAQGKTVGWEDNAGSCTTGHHLHFHIRLGGLEAPLGGTPVDWPDQVSQTTASMWSTTSHYAVSNNPGVGYWGTGGANEVAAFTDEYKRVGGWAWRGSTSRMESTWEICNGSGNQRVIWGCKSQFGDIHFQTFRASDGQWRSALVNPFRNGVDGAVHWITRGFYAAYTDQYNASTVWSYFVGAPTGDEFQPFATDPDLLRLNFEGGYYMLWRRSQCLVGIYQSGVQKYVRQGSASCDGGGGLPYAGYGSDGD